MATSTIATTSTKTSVELMRPGRAMHCRCRACGRGPDRTRASVRPSQAKGSSDRAAPHHCLGLESTVRLLPRSSQCAMRCLLLSNQADAKPMHTARGLYPAAERSPQPMHGTVLSTVWSDAPWPQLSQVGSCGMASAARRRRISSDRLMRLLYAPGVPRAAPGPLHSTWLVRPRLASNIRSGSFRRVPDQPPLVASPTQGIPAGRRPTTRRRCR